LASRRYARKLRVVEKANVIVERAKHAVIAVATHISDSKLPFNEFLGLADKPRVVVWRSFNDATRPNVLTRQWRSLVAERADSYRCHMAANVDLWTPPVLQDDSEVGLLDKPAGIYPAYCGTRRYRP